jgi:hypothetical protein
MGLVSERSDIPAATAAMALAVRVLAAAAVPRGLWVRVPMAATDHQPRLKVQAEAEATVAVARALMVLQTVKAATGEITLQE